VLGAEVAGFVGVRTPPVTLGAARHRVRCDVVGLGEEGGAADGLVYGQPDRGEVQVEGGYAEPAVAAQVEDNPDCTRRFAAADHNCGAAMPGPFSDDCDQAVERRVVLLSAGEVD
jgi:hypothetical protein